MDALRRQAARLSHALNALCQVLLTLLGAGMALVIGLQVFFRYALNDSLFWSEELGRMCLVWLTFIGATVAYRRGAHIGVDVLTSRLSPTARRTAAVLALSASLAFFMASAWGGWNLFGLLAFQTMPALGLSKQIPFAVVPFSFVVLTVHGLSLLLDELAGEGP
ncbi:MAG: TRAP transporter small permease [Proteobacteria bacterium]|nr:TRAP transporter small permease [Pseudomonadota bacterium]